MANSKSDTGKRRDPARSDQNQANRRHERRREDNPQRRQPGQTEVGPPTRDDGRKR